MRRIAIVTTVLIVVVGVFAAANRTTAQDDAQAADHPLVGSWVITFPDDPTAPPSLYTFGADGTVVGSSVAGARHGAWSAVDDTGAELTVVGLAGSEPIGVLGLLRIRGSVEVDEADDRFDLSYEVEAFGRDGAQVVLDGPFRAEGVRIATQSSTLLGTPNAAGTPTIGDGDGTPVSRLDEVIATALATAYADTTFPGEDATPEAGP